MSWASRSTRCGGTPRSTVSSLTPRRERTYRDPDPDDAEDVPPESPARGVVDDDAEDAPEPSEPA